MKKLHLLCKRRRGVVSDDDNLGTVIYEFPLWRILKPDCAIIYQGDPHMVVLISNILSCLRPCWREAVNKKEKKYNANCFHKTYSSQVTLTLR